MGVPFADFSVDGQGFVQCPEIPQGVAKEQNCEAFNMVCKYPLDKIFILRKQQPVILQSHLNDLFILNASGDFLNRYYFKTGIPQRCYDKPVDILVGEDHAAGIKDSLAITSVA